MSNDVVSSAPPGNTAPITIESASELGKRAFALGKYEEAVESYAMALELLTETFGQGSPQSADLLFVYGKALLENAVAQSAVLGKDDADAATKEEEDKAAAQKASKFHFGGDAEEDEEGVLTFKQEVEGDDDDAESEEGAEEQGDEAPEDDFNAAWDVLDLARSLYAKMDDNASKLKLADTYVALGDVSLETEKFDQAISDYTAGLRLKESLLPIHHRQIAEAHYKLGLVLDLTSGRLGDAISEVQKAVESISVRLELLHLAVSGDSASSSTAADPKGKGKATAVPSLPEGDPIAALTPEQVASEIKEFEDLRRELEDKIEDLKAAPNFEIDMSAPALAALQLTKELAAGSSAGSQPGQVNDLTGMVKKKKPKGEAAPADSTSPLLAGTLAVQEANGHANGKRKAEDDMDSIPEKKIKTDDSA